jgi:hypothetical protein
MGGPLLLRHLLLLLSIHPLELPVVLAVGVFVHMAWTPKDDLGPLEVAAYLAAVRASVQPHLPASLCERIQEFHEHSRTFQEYFQDFTRFPSILHLCL